MSANVDLVKRVVEACEAKDAATLRTLIDTNYTLKDPMMTLHGPEELIKMVEDCPFDGKITEAQYLDAGSDKVVMIATCSASAPTAFEWRMCDVLTIKNGKVLAEEMFYDTAQFPKEAFDSVSKAAGSNTPKKKAA